MTTSTKQPESPSISPSIEEILSTKCPHCAVAKFLMIWRNRHPETTAKDVVGSLIEVIADTLQCRQDKREVGPLALQAFLELALNVSDIIEGNYKDGEPVEVRGDGTPRKGGLH